jgi:hypothetical protein
MLSVDECEFFWSGATLKVYLLPSSRRQNLSEQQKATIQARRRISDKKYYEKYAAGVV